MKIFFLSLWMKQIDFLSDTMDYARNKNDFFIDNWDINVYNFSKWLPLHVPINIHYVNKEYVYYVYQKQYDFLDHQCKRKKKQTLILNYCILTLCLSIFCLCIEVNYQTIIWKVNSRWNTYILGFFTCYWRNYCLFVYLIYNRAYFRLCSLTFTPSFWISYILKGKMRVCNLFPLIKYMMY